MLKLHKLILYSLLRPDYWTIALTSILTFILMPFRSPLHPNRPPGPVSLPLVGYFPLLRKNAHRKLAQLSKTYGKVFSFYLGSKYTVVLGDYLSVKEAYSKTTFLGRPPTSYSEIIPDGIGFSETSGEEWVEQRRASMNILKELGFGKDSVEQQIKEEISELVSHVQEADGKPCDIRSLLVSSMSNNIVSLVFGKRLEYGSPKRKFLDHALYVLSIYLNQTGIAHFLPWLKRILTFFGIGTYKELSVLKDFNGLVNDTINEHRKNLDENHPRDYIDHYLLEMERRQKKQGPSTFTVPRLRGNCQTLFSGGSDTVQLTVNWSLIAMAMHPKIQSLVHEEIDNEIGREKNVDWRDHTQLPYTQATLMEVQRWRTVVPLGLSRYTTEDTFVGGYMIPKGTIILPNIWACHNDPKYWPEPEVFRPERHLSDDKKTVIKQDSYIPFSYGKRYCPGENFANLQLFLYFTTIMKNFIVKCPKGFDSDLEGDSAITLQIKPHKLEFICRN